MSHILYLKFPKTSTNIPLRQQTRKQFQKMKFSKIKKSQKNKQNSNKFSRNDSILKNLIARYKMNYDANVLVYSSTEFKVDLEFSY